MNAKQQTLVDKTVDNYHSMDKLKAESKLSIDEMFVEMSKDANKNYDVFVKDPEAFIAEHINKYMNDNTGLIKQSALLGVELGDAINET